MRGFKVSLLLATLFGGAASAQTCMQPTEQLAFRIVALKSSLMVGALSCGEGEQYDSFMTAFQPYILAEQHVMDSYFRRSGGLAGQALEDDFVTTLANTQSADSIAKGAGYCAATATLFSQIAGLAANGDLNGYVTANPLPTPISTSACGVMNHMHHERPGQTLTVAALGPVDRHLHHTQPAAEIKLASAQ